MSKMVWDQPTERVYETGVEQVALFPQAEGAYPKGVAWNGISALNLNPSGAEATSLYANNSKYLTLMSVEEMGGSIEAYMYPDEWAECDGTASAADGLYVGQQPRKPFGLVGKTLLGNDSEGTAYGYKLHLVYGGMASPTENSNSTVNDSPEAKTMSWEFSTTPVTVPGFKPTSYLYINSAKADPAKLKALEDIIYGTAETDGRLPMPAEVIALMSASTEEDEGV